MANNVRTVRLGAATVSVIDLYDIPSKMEDLLKVPPGERTPATNAILARTVNLPVQCILVRLAGLVALVDAGDYEREMDGAGRTDYAPPSLVESLAAAGTTPSEVEHVVITHAHGDHFNSTTFAQSGRYEPTFPKADVYVGRADWEAAGLQQKLGDPASLESRTFGVLHRIGRLAPVAGDRELGRGMTILAAPGETPGHQILRVRSEGQTLYCVGDLWHDPIEVDHPTWMVPWADAAANLRSRQAVAEAALAENALVVATHIAGIGRLKRTGAGVAWESVE